MIRRSTGKFLILCALATFRMTSVFGQVTDYSSLYWLFGQSKYGITYKKSDFSAQLDSIQNPVFGTGGSAVATDPYSGDLLFYSDGSLVYDRGHQLISGYTAGLNGNTSGDQPALVAAVPGQANFYFIISNSASTSAPGSIFAARINMNLQGNAPLAANPGYGVMQNTFNTQITANASEGMAVVAAPGGSQYWLITHERGTAVFNVTPVNSVGIDNTKTTTYDFSSRGFPPMEAANLCFSQAVNKLAVSPRDTSLNVQILDFSVTSGTLAYDTVVYNSANRDVSGIPGDDYSIYDTEWSGDGSKLYISRHGGAGITGMVYQYDVNNLTFTLATILQAPVYRSYGLKRGPDNNIYHIYQTVSGGPLLVG